MRTKQTLRRRDYWPLHPIKKRPSLDKARSQTASSIPTVDPIDMDPDLPEAKRLAHPRCFPMTENWKGKVLGCGEIVGVMPDKSRFVVRVYDRNFNLNGRLKYYVEMSYEIFSKFHSHKSEIEKKINDVHSREMIFESDDFRVTVGPPGYSINGTAKPTVEIEKTGTRIPMYIDTFTKMMAHMPDVNEEYSRFNMRNDDDKEIVDEILNALAYVRNGNRANETIRRPNLGRKFGIITTCNKIIEQAKMMLTQDE